MTTNIHFLALIAAMLACGTQVTKEVKVPTESSTQAPAPVTSAPQPQYLPPPQVPQSSTIDEYPKADTVPQTNADDSKVDPFGVPYDPTADVPYAEEYASQAPSQYNPGVPAYYAEVEQYMGTVTQPLPPYASDYPMPLLYDRYCQQRAFLNYQPSFRRVIIGDGRWDRSRYDRTRSQFDRSQRWINHDLYNQVNETLAALSSRQYHSPRRLESQIRGAIRRRDHRMAARLHDDLLQEAARGHGRDDRRDDRRNEREERRREGDGQRDDREPRNDRRTAE